MRWLAPDDAADLLSYERDREILRSLPSGRRDRPSSSSATPTPATGSSGRAPTSAARCRRRAVDQAVGLVDLLADFAVDRVLSSHYVRCLETVVPLACDRRRSIEVHPALAEGTSVGRRPPPWWRRSSRAPPPSSAPTAT